MEEVTGSIGKSRSTSGTRHHVLNVRRGMEESRMYRICDGSRRRRHAFGLKSRWYARYRAVRFARRFGEVRDTPDCSIVWMSCISTTQARDAIHVSSTVAMA
jgi:hypothetical protein